MDEAGRPAFLGGAPSQVAMMPKYPLPILILLIVTCSGVIAAPPLEQDAVREAAKSYREENWLAALEQFKLVAERASDPESAASANFYAGECSLQLGRHTAAKQAYQQVINTPAGAAYHARSAFRMGEIARLTGITAEAEFTLRQFLSKYPHEPLAPAASTLVGDIAAERGEHQKAIALYQYAINHETQDSSEIPARLGMARALLASGKGSQVSVALGALTQCEDANIKLQALVLRGRAEYDAEQYDRSLKTFRSAYQLPVANPLVNRARLAAGWSLWKLARHEDIVAEIGQIPTDSMLASEYHYLLGMAAYSSQNWTTAIGELTQAVAEATSSLHGAALFYLGESCLRNEQFAQAKMWLKQLIDNHSESEWADDALWALGQIARKTRNLTEFEWASALLRSRYPASAYLPLLNAEPWSENSSDNSPAIGISRSEAFEEAVGLERDGYFDAALAAYAEYRATAGATSLHAEALWRTARLHDRLSQKTEAAVVFTQLLADFPLFDRSADALLSLARLEADLGQHVLATNRHKEVLEKFPQSPQADEAAYWLALAAADGKDSKSAKVYVDSLLNSWDPAEEIVSERHKSLRAQAVCLKCQLEAEVDRWEEISHLLGTFTWKSETGLTTARLAYWDAEADFRLKKYSAAREKFENIQLLIVGTAEPWHPMVPLRRAQLASRLQQWKLVLEIISEIEDSYPEFELAYEADYLRGRALAGLGQMSEARRAYQEVLQNELTNGLETAAMAEWMIGETYFHQHDYENAQGVYQQVMLDHRFPEWQAKAALQAGKCAELAGHWQEAVELYQQALKSWQGTGVAGNLARRLEWAQRQATLKTSILRK